MPFGNISQTAVDKSAEAASRQMGSVSLSISYTWARWTTGQVTLKLKRNPALEQWKLHLGRLGLVLWNVKQNLSFAFGGSHANYVARMWPKTLNIWKSIPKKSIPPCRLNIFNISPCKVSKPPLEEKEVDANNVIFTFTFWLVTTQWVHGHPKHLYCAEHSTVNYTF